MLSHYAWPGGLAFVIETPRRRFAAVLGPRGWKLGDAREVWRAGPPTTATMAALELPGWLERQLPSLEFTQIGLHTDFVRLNRMLARMQSERACGAVVVLGPQPAAFVLSGGAPVVVYPTGRDGEHADMVAARAIGWVCVMSGHVVVGGPDDEAHVPVPPTEALDEAAPIAAGPPSNEVAWALSPEPDAASMKAVAAPQPPAAPEAALPEPVPTEPVPTEPVPTEPVPTEPVATELNPTAPVAAPPAPPSGLDAGERFVAAAGTRALSPEIAARVDAVAGSSSRQIIALLDGSRTLGEVAQATGVSAEQVGQVVRVLVGAKLAFRYVSRVRPATGARSQG